LSEAGERINLASQLVEGKRNVLFFHAPWSKTSSRYKVELERWQKTHEDTAVLLVNVKTLKSPVAKQFQLQSVPTFAIYDAEGTLQESGQKAHNEVVKMLKE